MFLNLLQKFFGSHNERLIKRFKPLVDKINSLEPSYEKMTDAELKALTTKYKERVAAGESLDDILPEAFASVREAAKRTLGQRPYDVQLIGGIILSKGMISEMATGEGKTLVATLPSYLYALTGRGVHVVTVNDYLAYRDSQWMGKIHQFLGLTVGAILNEMNDEERRAAYACDITYATNNELGFDYLRDNMKFTLDEMVQRDFHYAIVDEVDSILIDEARTPLIISGPAEDSSDLYLAANQVIPQLVEGDYEKEEKSRAITLTEQGSQKVEDILENMGLLKGASLYDLQNISLVHHVNQALKAHKVFNRDVDYIVKDNRVIIIDEFTGRMMDGRRYSDGLHQAIEAKEKVSIQMENQTLASITFQNYFRLYEKLSGMTGTAKTEAAEFADIYNLEVVQIPTNVPIARIDADDEVYRTEREKIEAIVKLVKEAHERKQPVLIGTVSIEKSEELSKHLNAHKIPHEVLNARYHDREASIIAQAGMPGAVTIATNMAGRGTDIKLGGNVDMRLEHELSGVTDPKERESLTQKIRKEMAEAEAFVKQAGGLFVIGTERHESRRIDNQLRGRSGRQGDPGRSQFFLSLQDELMRRFGSDRLEAMLVRLGLEEGEAITHPWVNKALERAQQKVEAYNYEIRKHLLRYDNVMNDQRKVIYEQRREIMGTTDSSALLKEMISDVLEELVDKTIPQNTYVDQWNAHELHGECLALFNLNLPIEDWFKEEGIADREIMARLEKAIHEHFEAKEVKYEGPLMRYAERSILMRVLDQSWKDHLHALDHLRQGIGLRGYAQRDPLNEYKQEAFNMFHDMLARVRYTVVSLLSHLEMSVAPDEEELENPFEDMESPSNVSYSGPGLASPEPEFEAQTVGSLKERLSKGRKASASKPKPMAPKRPSKSKAEKTEADVPEALTMSDAGISFEETPRNSLCPCGSGKRFKHCHGALESDD